MGLESKGLGPGLGVVTQCLNLRLGLEHRGLSLGIEGQSLDLNARGLDLKDYVLSSTFETQISNQMFIDIKYIYVYECTNIYL